jgi:hypothetical protein
LHLDAGGAEKGEKSLLRGLEFGQFAPAVREGVPSVGNRDRERPGEVMVSNRPRSARARSHDGRRRRAPWRRVWPVVTAGAAALVASIVILAQGGGQAGAAPTRAGVEAYDAAIKAPVQHWGKIATLGMRAALGDLQSGQGVPPAMIAGEARAWQDGLRQVEQQMRDAAVPASLHPAANGFDQAVKAYLRAAQLFEQAAAGDADTQALVRVGLDVLTHADCGFDDAAIAVQSALRSVGLPPDPDLPDAPCSPS